VTKPRAYGFFSAKGGSGKTALATAAAFAFDSQGERVAVLDVDFTGTSIADGLGLQAPGPGGALLSLEQTQAARRDATIELPFLDAAMAADGPAFDPIAMAWQHPEAPEVLWYPSSPLSRHIRRIQEHILAPEPEEVQARLTVVLRALLQAPGRPVTCLIFDLGTGIHGMPGVVAGAADTLDCRYQALLVSGPDHSDLDRGAELAAYLIRGGLPVRWTLNRNKDLDLKAARDGLRSRIGGGRRDGVWSVLENFGYHDRLDEMFRRDTLGFTTEELERFADRIVLGRF